MPENIKPVLEFLTLNGFLSAAGGVVKIMFGIAKGNMTFIGAFTALFVAVLLGVYSGKFIAGWSGSEDMGNITSVVMGIAAYNLAEAVEGLGFKSVLQSIVNRGGNGKNH